MRALIAFLTLAGAAIGGEITGPTGPVAMGGRIVLDASGIEASAYQWDVATDDSRYMLFDAGKTLCFWSPAPGSYRFALFAATVGADMKVTIARHTFIVQVSGSVPIPGPTPGPGPGPTPAPIGPTFPDSELGLSLAIYTAAKDVPNAAKDSSRMADAFFGVAAQIAAGTLKGQKAVIAATQTATQAVAGSPERVKEWLPVLGVALAKELQRLDTAGKLGNDKAIGAAWFELGVGLKAVK